MKYFIAAWIYLMIGIGVTTGYAERHHLKEELLGDSLSTALAAWSWPAFVAADIYRWLKAEEKKGMVE